MLAVAVQALVWYVGAHVWHVEQLEVNALNQSVEGHAQALLTTTKGAVHAVQTVALEQAEQWDEQTEQATVITQQ